MSKRAALLFIVILTVSSLILVNLALASITKPSVPEFTLKFEAHPYDVPPTYGIDPYTGETVTTRAGYHVKNESIVVAIKNQPFTPYTDTDNNSVTLSFIIRVKGHFEEGWTILVHIDSSDSEYVIMSLPYGEDAGYGILRGVPTGGKLDFQVDAQTGYYTYDPGNCKEYFTGETSGWSNTQTITIGTSSSSPSPSPSPSPPQNSTTPPDQSSTQPTTPTGLNEIEIAILTALIIIVVLLIAIVGLALRKRR